MPAVEVCHELTEGAHISPADDDAALLRNYATSGDKAAIEELFRRHTDLLFRTAQRWRGHASDADDGVQTTILHVLQHAAQFKGQSTVRAWLMSILLNALRRQVRDDRHEQTRRDATGREVNVSGSTERDPELVSAALQTVSGLPQHYRIPICLHYLENLSMREVAAALAVPEKTIRSQIDRGLDHVRESLLAAGFSIAVPAIPALLAGAELPVAPAALTAAIKATISHSAAKGAAVSVGSSALAAKIAVATLLAAGVLVAVLRSGGGTTPMTGADAGPSPRVEPVKPVNAPDANKDLASILAQKIDVNYWRDYPSEVLANLKCRTGFPYAYPDAVEHACTLDLKRNAITVREVLEQLAAAGGLELDIGAERILIWKKAGDAEIEELTKHLHDSDRWVRAEAAWDLSRLGDKRVCPLLLQACADRDAGVGRWAVSGLCRHLTVLPYVDADKSAACSIAEQDSTLVLGALSTPRGTTKLLELAASSNNDISNGAINGLGYDKAPRAFEYIYEQASRMSELHHAQQMWSESPEYALCSALSRSDDPRAIDCLTKLAHASLEETTGINQALFAVSSLALLHDRRASAAAAERLAQRETYAVLCSNGWLDASDPLIADALIRFINDKDEKIRNAATMTLARARDPRLLGVLLKTPEPQNSFWVQNVAGLRDPRGEAAAARQLNSITADTERASYLGMLARNTRNPKYIDELFAVVKDARKDRAIRVNAANWLLSGRETGNLLPKQYADFMDWLKKTDAQFILAMLFEGWSKEQLYGKASWDRDGRWIEMLAAQLRSPDNEMRQNAALALCGCNGPYAMKVCIELIGGEDAQLRSEVLARFCKLGSRRILCGDPKLADTLAARLADNDPEANAYAACALGMIRDPRAPAALLIELAHAKDPVATLGFHFSDECTPQQALMNLCVSGNSEATAAILDLMRIPGLTFNLHDRMVKSGNPKLLDAVEALALDATASAGVRFSAGLSLVRYATKRPNEGKIREVLTQLLTSPDINAESQSIIVGTLARSGNSSDLDALFVALRNAPAGAVAACMGSAVFDDTGERALRRKLLEFARDKTLNINLRSEAASSLVATRIGESKHTVDPAALELLEEFVKAEGLSEQTRLTTYWSLSGCGDPRGVAIVKHVLESGTPREKLAAAGPLANKVGDEKAVDVLLQSLESANKKDSDSSLVELESCQDSELLSEAVRKKVKSALDKREKKNSGAAPENSGF